MVSKETDAQRQEKVGGKALIDVDLVGVGGQRAFRIRNLGEDEARDLAVEIEAEEGKISPLVRSEVEERLPIRRLRPGEEVRLSAVVTTGTGIHFTAVASWVEADGNRRSERTELTV